MQVKWIYVRTGQMQFKRGWGGGWSFVAKENAENRKQIQIALCESEPGMLWPFREFTALEY